MTAFRQLGSETAQDFTHPQFPLKAWDQNRWDRDNKQHAVLANSSNQTAGLTVQHKGNFINTREAKGGGETEKKMDKCHDP